MKINNNSNSSNQHPDTQHNRQLSGTSRQVMTSWTTSLMMSQLVFRPAHRPVSAPLALQELEEVLELTAALQGEVFVCGGEGVM